MHKNLALIGLTGLMLLPSAQANSNYQVIVPAITNLHANPDWHRYSWWAGEGSNPIEIPVVAGESVSIFATGLVEFSAVRAPGGENVFGPDGSPHNGLADNGTPWYSLSGVWVSAVDHSATPYWSLTPIGEEFLVGSEYQGVAPAGAVALMVGLIDPNFVVDQNDIDSIDYYSQEDLGKLDGDGQLTLSVTTSAGKSAFLPTFNPPTAVLEASTLGGTAPLSVDFSGDKSRDDGQLVRYRWQFGDGSPTAEGASLQHTFNQPGTYTVSLTAVDEQSLSDIESATIQVVANGENVPPTPRISITQGNEENTPLQIMADASDSIDTDGIVSSWQWDFGDGTVLQGKTILHLYAAPGEYTVQLTVTDNVGSSATSQQAVTVSNDAPPAAVNPDPQPSPSGEPSPASQSGQSGGGSSDWMFLLLLAGFARLRGERS